MWRTWRIRRAYEIEIAKNNKQIQMEKKDGDEPKMNISTAAETTAGKTTSRHGSSQDLEHRGSTSGYKLFTWIQRISS